MIIKYKKFLLFLILFVNFFVFIAGINASAGAQEKIMYGNACPKETTVGFNNIIFVGKAALGGDVAVHTWFEWGTSSNNLNQKTQIITLNKEDFFCVQVFGLSQCSVYYYRAAAKNTAGVNYGEIKSKQTLCGADKQNAGMSTQNDLQKKIDLNKTTSKKISSVKKYKDFNKNKKNTNTNTNNLTKVKNIDKKIEDTKNIRKKSSNWFIF